jgi:hypothetical protein
MPHTEQHSVPPGCQTHSGIAPQRPMKFKHHTSYATRVLEASVAIVSLPPIGVMREDISSYLKEPHIRCEDNCRFLNG